MEAIDSPTSGAWLIETASQSSYIIDFEAKTCSRYPSPEASRLRMDGDTISFLEVVNLELGEPMELFLSIREDGVPTYRRTTPITAISSASI